MTLAQIIKNLREQRNLENVAGMARFGINPNNTLGVPIPYLRALAKKIGRDHQLARQLWQTKIHEARILAGMIDEPLKVSKKQIDQWAADFDSWDVCDQICLNLFDKTPFAFQKAVELTKSKKEFVRRSGFALMAALAFHNKTAKDAQYIKFFSLIKKYATDERNYVKKAVNWALRQIGKRNATLNKAAIKTAREILTINTKSARWIAGEALRELTGEAAQKRLNKR